MIRDEQFLNNLIGVVKYSDANNYTISASKTNITLVGLNEKLHVCNSYNNINVWASVGKSVFNFENAEYQSFILRVELNKDETEQDLLFPFLSALHLAQQSFDAVTCRSYTKLSQNILVVLLIDLQSYDDSERIRQYLSYFINGCENLFIVTRYIYTKSDKKKDQLSEYTYSLLKNDYCDFGNVFPLLPISNMEYSKNFNFVPLDFDDIYSLGNVDYYNNAIKQITNVLIANMAQMYKSIKKKKAAQKETKKIDVDFEIEKEFQRTIFDKFNSMTTLAQLIWLNMLRSLAVTKDENDRILLFQEKFDVEIDDFRMVFDNEAVMSTYFSAIEYADGISQILENAVQHSKGHIGFFSMRTYYVDLQSPPSEAIKCAQYRKSITQKYYITGNDLFRNCRFIIEFNIIDYAIPINGDTFTTQQERKDFYSKEVSGILDVFHKNNPDIKLEDDSLRGVFNYQSDNVNQIVEHLGLKLFKQLICENYGVFRAISPRNDGKKDFAYYYHKYNRKVDDNNGNQVRGFTRYSIVLPIKEQIYVSSNKVVSNAIFAVDESLFNGEDISMYKIDDIQVNNALEMKYQVMALHEYYKEKIFEIKSDCKVIPVISLKLNENFMRDCERLAKASLLLQDSLNREDHKKRFFAINFSCDNADLADQAVGVFIRVYASFYKKTLGEKIASLDNNSQIALFVTISNEHDSTGTMQHVLNIYGNNFDDLRDVAEHFVYSGQPFALKQANQLRFLLNKDKDNSNDKRIKKGAERVINLFPFDLFVNDVFTKSDSVFISSVKSELEHEMVTGSCGGQAVKQFRNGVCLSNTHVSLATGIHIDKFYQAELLFYNNLTIKKFAILIVRDLIKQMIGNEDYATLAKDNGIVVIGYENYSHVMTEQIAYYLERYVKQIKIGNVLKKKDNPRIIYGTYAGQIDIVNGIKTRVIPKFRLQHLVKNDKSNVIDLQMSDLLAKDKNGHRTHPLFVIIEPIGTTANTIQQIRRALRFFAKGKIQSINYSLIISAPRNNAETPIDTNWEGLRIRSHYCEGVCDRIKLAQGGRCADCSRNGECIKAVSPLMDKFGNFFLRRDGKNSDAQPVQYLIHAESKWFSARNCSMCDKDVALDWVDKTSTNTYLIHELLNSKRKGITYALHDASPEQIRLNDERIELLRGNIVYGHTQTQSNHFLYNLDLKHVLESNIKYGDRKKQVTCREQVEEWLQSINLDTAAFNILIAPLHERNSPFVRMVSEFALKQNIRFIHFDVSMTPREATRANFIYVADEIAAIIKDAPRNEINIYYCDDSTVSGESLHRAMLLIRMLLNEAGIAEQNFDRIHLFKGVIFFVNRSSYETLQQFVKEPTTDVHSFIYLGVPNYNTNQGVCYDCNFIKKLELQKKRTVSSLDICDIDRLIHKHQLLTVVQFWKVIKGELFSSGKYVKWLKSWRMMHPDEPLPLEIQKVLTRLKERVSEYVGEINEDTPEKVLNDTIKQIGDICLNDLIPEINDENEGDKNNDYNREAIWQFFKNKVIAERYFLRLLCTHKLYCKLESITRNQNDNDELYKHTLTTVLDLLIEERDRISKNRKTIDEQYALDTPKGYQRYLIYYCELFISYIKILSREQLARFYHIRQAAIDIMLFMLIACTKGIDAAKSNAIDSERLTEKDGDIFERYEKVLSGLLFVNINNSPKNRTQKNSLNAGSQAFLVISLIKKIAQLDSTFFMRNRSDKVTLKIEDFPKLWLNAVNKYLGKEDYINYYDESDKSELIALTTMPSFDYCINVYQNALRWTLLTTYDEDGKSYRTEYLYNINRG